MSFPSVEVRNQLDPLLRQCVACGLCLPHCATFQASGNEVLSPRGRLQLLSQILKHPETSRLPSYAESFELCIGCRACETACPGGVPFSLLEYGQQVTSVSGKPETSPLARWAFPRLDSVFFLRCLGAMARVTRSVLRRFLGPRWRQRCGQRGTSQLVRMLGTIPLGPGSDEVLVKKLKALCPEQSGEHISLSARFPDQELPSPPPSVLFFKSCANEGLLFDSTRRLIQLLEACGCRVNVLDSTSCCGALASHTGQPSKASAQHLNNLAIFKEHLEPETKIVIEAAGCGVEVLENYDSDISSATTDAVRLLCGLSLPPLGKVALKVAYHDPCHALHGQGIFEEPRDLLSRIPGVELVQQLEAEVCCGSGGAWGISHPNLSDEIGRRKARHLAATGADLVVTSNPGCLGQIADGLALEAPDLPIIPLSDLLWFSWQKHQQQIEA